MRLTKTELKVMAAVVVDGTLAIHYRDWRVETARKLVRRGLLACRDSSADHEVFTPTRVGTKRMLVGVT